MRVLVVVASAHRIRYIEAALLYLRSVKGLDVVFASLAPPGPAHRALQDQGCPALSLAHGPHDSRWRAGRAIDQMGRGIPFDVVHAHEVIPTIATGLTWHRSRGPVRVFHRFHGDGRARLRVASRLATGLSHFTVAVSAFAAEQASRSDRRTSRRIAVAYNGVPAMRDVPVEELEESRRLAGIPGDACTVVMVGRFRAEKGHAALLESLPIVARSIERPLHAVLVGDGPLRDEIASKASSLPGCQVHFVGHQEDVAPWYALADVVAVPSLRDAFPLTVVEAMASAKPIVASSVGGIPEAISSGRTGLLAPPGDAVGFAGEMIKMLSDASVAGSLAAAGKLDYLARFTTEHMAEQWLSGYQAALELPRRWR
jgi:glycosyltransferase involved in cell wall biosynthesis